MQTTAPAQVHIGRLSTRAGAALLIACVHPLAAPRGAPHHARVTHLCAICGGAAVVRMVGRRGQELRELRRRGQRLCELRQGRRTDTVRCGGAGRGFFFLRQILFVTFRWFVRRISLRSQRDVIVIIVSCVARVSRQYRAIFTTDTRPGGSQRRKKSRSPFEPRLVCPEAGGENCIVTGINKAMTN